MTHSSFTAADLTRILRETAGVDEAGGLEDALDSSFEELGYDSLALMETSSRIKREFGVELPDESLVLDRSPNSLVDEVRTAQGAVAAL